MIMIMILKLQDGEGSTRNEGEALVVAAHLARLIAAGVRQDHCGVLTPYNAQARTNEHTHTEMTLCINISH